MNQRVNCRRDWLVLNFTLLVLVAHPPTVLAQGSSSAPPRSTVPNSTVPNSTSNQAPVEEPYTLGPGDRISIIIFQLTQYSGEQTVLVNGTVNLPQVGGISVQGMTLEQVAAAITARYEQARVLRNPKVTVSLVIARSLRIGVAGEVNRPGSYTLALTGSQLPTLTTALKTAGGITQSAELQQVQVRRPRRGGSDQVMMINLFQLLQSGDLRYDLTLRDGDTIFVPTATLINPAIGPQLATANFAPDQGQPVNIGVSGEVVRPGPYTLAAATAGVSLSTVTQALQAAGGVKLLADIERIQVRRITKTGFEQIVEVNLMPLLTGGDLQQDLILQTGDSIFVPTVPDVNLVAISRLQTASFAPENAESLNVAVIGQVFRPGPYTVTGTARTGAAGIPGSGDSKASSTPTVTRAIQVAGGVKPMADIRSIEIRRTTNAGATQVININLWELLQAGDANQDAILQEGDTVFVPEAEVVSSAEMAQVAQASFSPNSIRVNVVGEIKQPGSLEIPPNTPLNRALLAAGGFTDRAHQDSIELIRFDANGQVEKRKVNLDFAQGLNSESNPALQNNDVIIVNRSTLASIGDTVQTIITPLNQ
ncbi:MAG: SLBB domain-containing protein, partial [Microcoleaceae cyanobacterium]